MRFLAAPGEKNSPSFGVADGLVVIREYELPVTAGSGCTQRSSSSQSANAVHCPASGVARIRFDLGDGDDQVWQSEEPGTLAFHVYGGPGDDALSGGSGNDLLDGGDGKDSLNGGAGKDVVLGGAGSDSLADGDSDADRVEGGDGDDNLAGGDSGDTLQGGAGDDDLSGGDGDDELDGGPGDDKLDGGRGDDKLVAGTGDDDVDGGRGADRIDTADSQPEHTLTCGQGADQLTGDGEDPINVDCETFAGGRTTVGRSSGTFPVGCPGGCTAGRIVLTMAGKRLGEGRIGRSAAHVRFNRRLTTGRNHRVRATIVARDSAGREYRSHGRFDLRAR